MALSPLLAGCSGHPPSLDIYDVKADVTYEGVLLSWKCMLPEGDANRDANAIIRIERSRDGEDAWKAVAEDIDTRKGSYLDQSILPNLIYKYRIRMCGDGKCGICCIDPVVVRTMDTWRLTFGKAWGNSVNVTIEKYDPQTGYVYKISHEHSVGDTIGWWDNGSNEGKCATSAHHTKGPLGKEETCEFNTGIKILHIADKEITFKTVGCHGVYSPTGEWIECRKYGKEVNVSIVEIICTQGGKNIEYTIPAMEEIVTFYGGLYRCPKHRK